jgi:hypothetical protein
MVHPSQVLSLAQVFASKPERNSRNRAASPVTVSTKFLVSLVAMVSPFSKNTVRASAVVVSIAWFM